jgi:hypothetical protein
MTTGLIEDEDGAPYPQCKHCPDQVAPGPGGWAHVYKHMGRAIVFTYLYRCQRPFDGKYGPPNEATPDIDERDATGE